MPVSTAWDNLQTWMIMNVGSREADEISVLASALIAEEREACAKVADDMVSKDTDWDTSYWNQCAERVAMNIRARKEA